MKNLLLLPLLYCIALTACKKDDPVLTFFKCKIDGVAFESDSLQYPADNLIEGRLELRFENGNRSLILGIPEFFGEEGPHEVNWVSYDNGSATFLGDSGEVLITEINKKKEFISGAFSGVCSPIGGGVDMEITDGEFVMEYYEF